MKANAGELTRSRGFSRAKWVIEILKVVLISSATQFSRGVDWRFAPKKLVVLKLTTQNGKSKIANMQ
jgi:hypothetical protein